MGKKNDCTFTFKMFLYDLCYKMCIRKEMVHPLECMNGVCIHHSEAENLIKIIVDSH